MLESNKNKALAHDPLGSWKKWSQQETVEDDSRILNDSRGRQLLFISLGWSISSAGFSRNGNFEQQSGRTPPH